MANLAHHSLAETALAELGSEVPLPALVALEEIELPLPPEYGSLGGPEFSTRIFDRYDGAEQRQIERTLARWRFELGRRVVTRQELDLLQTFHRQRRGMAVGFLFRDFGDDRMERQAVGTGDGSTTTFAAWKDYGGRYRRRLRRFVPGSVRVWLDGVETAAQVNVTEATVTFDPPPPAGALIELECEYLIPVRFGSDLLQASFEAWDDASGQALYRLGPVPLLELPHPIEHDPVPPLPSRTGAVLDLGKDYGATGGGAFSTRIYGDGRVRVAAWARERGDWQLGGRVVTRQELATLIGMFLSHYGQGLGFEYTDWNDCVLERQAIGTGDGLATSFEIARYRDTQGMTARNVQLPEASTVRVWVDGAEQGGGYVVTRDPAVITFAAPPAAGALIECACRFRKHARFATDRLAYRYLAGEAGQALFRVEGVPVRELAP